MDSRDIQSSIINIPLSININDVERVINKQVKGLLYEDMDMENNDNDQLMVMLKKDGEIRLQLNKQQLYYTVPLAIWIKKGVVLGAVELEGSLFLYFRTDFNIQEDWSLNTATEIERHEWRRKPKAKVGGFRLPVQLIADQVLKRSKESLGKAIDQQMKRKLELQKYVKEAWNKLHEPILLSEEYGMWLNLSPRQIGMTSLETTADLIFSTVSIESGTAVCLGEKPLAAPHNPLPGFQQKQHSNDDFKVNVDIRVPFEEAQKIAEPFVIGATFNSGNQEIKVEGLSLSSREEQLEILISVSGSYDGDIILIGTPTFNQDEQIIEMENLDFELGTRNIIFKSISWLFKKGLLKKIEEGLRFPLGNKIKAVKTLLSRKLRNYELAPHIHLQGNLETIDIGQTHIDANALSVSIQSCGKVNVRVEGLEI